MGPSVIIAYASITLLPLLIDPTRSDSNATALVLQSNSQRRTVKLYSGVKRDPITCIREGFLADPIDCATFYQCVLGRRGKYTIFKYQCGPGTVYDPDTEICNHPINTKRLECRGSTILPSSRDNDNEIVEPYQEHINEKTKNIDTETTTAKDLTTLSNSYPWISEVTKRKAAERTKIPLTINRREQNIATIKVTSPTTFNQNKTVAKNYKDIFHNPKHFFVHNPETLNKGTTTSKSTTTSKHSISHTHNLKSDDVCSSEGFVGDILDCRKFYRCVSNSRGGFIRYEFFCSEFTIWDDEVQVCNHPRSVKRTRCHVHNKNQIIITTPENNLNKIYDYGSKVTQVTQNVLQNISTYQNQTQYNIFNKISKKEDTKDHQYQIHQTTDSIIDKKNKIEVTKNEKYQTEPIPIRTDQTMKPSKMSTQMHAITKSTPKTIHYEEDNVGKQFNYENTNGCTETGFVGDPNNCKIFYRCVENGRGSFTKYEFTCSEGTVWDPKLDACNHAWAVKECGGKAINTVSTTQKVLITLSSTRHHQTTTESVFNEISHNMINENQNENPHYITTKAKTIATKVSTKSIASTTESVNENTKVCTAEGFVGDLNDCKKFYRCVDNGKGGYTKYEYNCGEGTLWDPSINGCNHAWAVKSCIQSSLNNINNVEITNNHYNSVITTVSPIQSTAMKPQYVNDHYDSSYTQEQIDETQSTTLKSISKTSTTAKQSLQHSSNDCIRGGFMGDDSDCKKFYRCVDNGKGAYTRYEYSCGEGTVWDPMIDSCNHEWAVEKCGGKPISNYDKVEVTSQSSTHISQKTDPEQSSTEKHILAITTISTTKPTNADDKNSECESSGFFGDTNDCTKFYRCVDNDKGGFYRYEFSCGEGTVWDSSLQSCNHEWAVKDCHNDKNQQMQSSTTLSSSLSSTNSQTDSQEVSHTSTEKTTTEENTITQGIVCSKEGFARDTNNCKKFYRCVDIGKGSFTKYEFNCGDGTIWNQDIQACDHASSKDITCSGDNENSFSTNPHRENDEMITETTTKISTTTLKVNTNTSMKPQTGSNSCKSEGYFSDLNDCKKFYRCVDNSKGGYIKYDFVCGEGTIWDQEIQGCNHDTGNKKCSKADTENTENETSVTQSQIETTTEMHNYGTSTSTNPNSTSMQKNDTHTSSTNDQCSSEGFYANSKDCKKFFRCINNGKGGYTKYDFTCGEGTVWVQEIQGCDHDNDESSCSRNNTPNATQQTPNTVTQQPNVTEMQTKPTFEDEQEQSTTQKSSSSQPATETSKPNKNNACDQEGYFGNKNDCKMFYRCVDNGKGGFTKYDYMCGEGTIWDQDVTTCNHPQNVIKQSCKSQNSNMTPQTPSGPGSTSETTTITSSTSESNSVSESSGTSTNPDENSSKNPENQNVTCNKAGYYANPNDCKKFYRCVDWDDNGKRFSVYHFECGDGTIWDPALETCNHEESVYPPRNCRENHSEVEPTTENTTVESTISTTRKPSTTTTTSSTTTTTKKQSTTTSTKKPPTTTTTKKASSTTTTTEKPTSQQSTTGSTTKTTKNPTTKPASTQQSTTTKKSTTSKPTTTKSPSTQQSTTTELTTTQQTTTTESTTTEQSTTNESTTTQQSTTDNPTTTQPSSTSEQTTTEPSTTTESSTTQQTTTTELTTTEPSATITEQTTTETTTTTESSTTQQSTTSEQSTTEPSITEQSTTESTTNGSETTTQESTTEQSTEDQSSPTTESSQSSNCPETDEDQNLFVCPTSFKRHPRYCNIFYQCTEEEDTHEPKIAVFHCPNNTIYDESKTQCLEESKVENKCNGEIAERRRFKRLNFKSKEPIVVDKSKRSCVAVGHFPFETNYECSPAFLKCEKTKNGMFRGFVHQCPPGYLYWTISRRCEKDITVRDCKRSSNNWSGHWAIPVEKQI